MKVLSLFDGMACGMLAMMQSEIDVERYVAFEIDKYAVQTSSHNFPMIEHRGDVFAADFTEFIGFDYLVGGSPCTYWSIAQKNGRETEASGMGWELFSQYVRALREAKPRFFIYENNKSMANAIRESITETFGFEPICINSALVSAQNRNRLYWVGRRNADGTYSKVDVQQPADRGILLRDILEGVTDKEKGRCVLSSIGRTTTREYFDKSQNTMAFEPVGVSTDGKAFCLTVSYPNCVPHDTLQKSRRSMVAEPVACRCRGRKDKDGNGYAKYECREDGKANTLDTNTVNGAMVSEPVCMRYERSDEAKAVRKQYEAGEIHHGFHELSELHPRTDGKTNTLSTVLKDNPICEPVGTGYRGRMENGEWKKRYEAREDDKANALTTAQTDSMVSEPVRVGCYPSPDGTIKNSQAMRLYSVDGKSVNMTANGGGLGAKTGLYAVPVEPMIVKEATKQGYTEIQPGECVDMTQPNSKTRRGRNMADKSNCLMTACQYYQYCGVLTYATPCEFDENGNPIKAISAADGKVYTVYPVVDGEITIKGKTYPIKLIDGYYIIRKLTVRECMRLQTVPEWYEWPVSDSQAYKMLGNGWTVSVISWLIEATKKEPVEEELETQMAWF